MLFCRSAAVLGRPRSTEARITWKLRRVAHSQIFDSKRASVSYAHGCRRTGAAEDGRAPTEEHSCVRGLGLLIDGGGRGRTRSGSKTKRSKPLKLMSDENESHHSSLKFFTSVVRARNDRCHDRVRRHHHHTRRDRRHDHLRSRHDRHRDQFLAWPH